MTITFVGIGVRAHPYHTDGIDCYLAFHNDHLLLPILCRASQIPTASLWLVSSFLSQQTAQQPNVRLSSPPEHSSHLILLSTFSQPPHPPPSLPSANPTNTALVTHYQRRPGDTGSAEVQCVLLTERLNTLRFHLSRHPQDIQLNSNLQLIDHRRRKMLRYLKKERFRTYQVICRDLNIDERSMEIVGLLPTTKPYYNPARPKYRRPLTEEQLKEKAAKASLVKQQQEQQAVVDKKQAIKDAIQERRRQANMVDI